MILRSAILTAALLVTHVYVSSSRANGAYAAATPLSAVPLTLGDWRGSDEPAVDPETLRILAADDYLNRRYMNAAGSVVGLYIAFYVSQRAGDAIHSPQHCLPGNGWRASSVRRQTLNMGSRLIPVNQLLVQRGSDRRLVLYWFQGRGRSVANEYANKFFLVVDALRQGRTDGALVRITIPFLGEERAAGEVAAGFARQLYPEILQVLP